MAGNQPIPNEERRRWIPPLALAYLSLAWTAGMFAASLFDLPGLLLPATLAPLLAVPFSPRRARPTLLFVSLSLGAFFAAVLRVQP